MKRGEEIAVEVRSQNSFCFSKLPGKINQQLIVYTVHKADSLNYFYAHLRLVHWFGFIWMIMEKLISYAHDQGQNLHSLNFHHHRSSHLLNKMIYINK